MSLDDVTLKAMETLAKKWQISKAEVVRRAVTQLKQKADDEDALPTPLEAFDWLQNGGGLVAEEAANYKVEIEAERQAKKYWWEP